MYINVFRLEILNYLMSTHKSLSPILMFPIGTTAPSVDDRERSDMYRYWICGLAGGLRPIVHRIFWGNGPMINPRVHRMWRGKLNAVDWRRSLWVRVLLFPRWEFPRLMRRWGKSDGLILLNETPKPPQINY